MSISPPVAEGFFTPSRIAARQSTTLVAVLHAGAVINVASLLVCPARMRPGRTYEAGRQKCHYK